MKYRVFGVSLDGRKTLLRATRFSQEARRIRDQAGGRWANILVLGSEGELTILQLDRLAELYHQYV